MNDKHCDLVCWRYVDIFFRMIEDFSKTEWVQVVIATRNETMYMYNLMHTSLNSILLFYVLKI